MGKRKRLGDMLLEAGLISEFQLTAALNDQRKWGVRIGTSLTRLGFVSESKLISYLSEQYGIPGVDLDEVSPEEEALRALAPEMARQHLALPLSLRKGAGGKTVLRVALGDPANLDSLDELKFATNHPVEAVIASDHAIERAIDKYYFGKEDPADHVASSLVMESADDGQEMVILRGNIEEVIAAGPPPTSRRPSAPSAGRAPGARRGSRPDERAGEEVSGQEAERLAKALARLLIRKNLITREELQEEYRKK
jgi:type IV pilus assembly protein PilB